MALILRLQVVFPLLLIADMTEVGQLAGIDAIVAVTQRTDNGTAPDAVFDIEAAAGN